MRFAPRGVRPTEIATALNLRQNTLSHHLSDLASAGLVMATRQGRSLFTARYSIAAYMDLLERTYARLPARHGGERARTP